jgi:hypothetical protein
MPAAAGHHALCGPVRRRRPHRGLEASAQWARGPWQLQRRHHPDARQNARAAWPSRPPTASAPPTCPTMCCAPGGLEGPWHAGLELQGQCRTKASAMSCRWVITLPAWTRTGRRPALRHAWPAPPPPGPGHRQPVRQALLERIALPVRPRVPVPRGRAHFSHFNVHRICENVEK